MAVWLRTARPGTLMGLTKGKKPDYLFTVFAGVDQEATAPELETT